MHRRTGILVAAATLLLAACTNTEPQSGFPDSGVDGGNVPNQFAEGGFSEGGNEPGDAQPTLVCGNGVKNEATELCDDGNTMNGDGCSASCLLEGSSEIEPNSGIGNATPMNAHDDASMMGFYWFDGDKARQVVGWVPTPGFLCIPTKPHESSTAGASNVFWASVHNQFFTMISVPDAQ